MTVAAQAGLVGFAVQDAKVGSEGTFTPASETWYKVRAPRVNLAAIQSVQVLPPEIGGSLLPTGVYKDQVFFAGDVDLLPRLETAGFLFYGLMGKLVTTPDTYYATANVGYNTHKFTYDAASPALQKWMAWRRMVPGAIAADNNGETGFDCKINSMRITIPGRGKVAFRVGVQGRDFLMDDASTWAWANAAYEDAGLIPEAGRGHFKIGDTQYPLLGLQLDVVNGLSTPNDEMVIGSFNPDDFIALRRGVTLRATYKYQNDDLYRKILTGTADGTVWDSLPFFSETVGQVKAIEAFFESPVNVPGGATPQKYGFKLTAEKVAWQSEPAVLVGGGTVVLNLVGTVIEPATGDYFTIELPNNKLNTYYNPA